MDGFRLHTSFASIQPAFNIEQRDVREMAIHHRIDGNLIFLCLSVVIRLIIQQQKKKLK